MHHRSSVNDFDEYENIITKYNERMAAYTLRLLILEAKITALDVRLLDVKLFEKNDIKHKTRLSALTIEIKNFIKSNNDN